MAYWDFYPPRQTVGERKALAKRALGDVAKSGRKPAPVSIEGRTIARTLWGKSWCENLERYSDFANRLPRGRSYVRSGAVIDLVITRGEVRALVQGTRLYTVQISVAPLASEAWSAIVAACAGQIDSLVELLRGQLSATVMEIVTREEGGLFPRPKEIEIDCSCPDGARLCKHACAVLYGIGARFDRAPALLFELRGTDPSELVAAAATSDAGAGRASGDVLEEDDLAGLFGIELDDASTAPPPVEPLAPREAASSAGAGTPNASAKPPRARAKQAAKKADAKKADAKKADAKKARAESATTGPLKKLKKRHTRAELIAVGVPPGTISTWARAGILRATDARGLYAITAEARRRLDPYFAVRRGLP